MVRRDYEAGGMCVQVNAPKDVSEMKFGDLRSLLTSKNRTPARSGGPLTGRLQEANGNDRFESTT